MWYLPPVKQDSGASPCLRAVPTLFSWPRLPASVLKWGVKMHSLLHFELTLEASIGLAQGSLE